MPSTLTIRKLTPGDPAEIARLYEICLLTGKDGKDATALYRDPKLLGELYVGAYARFHPELAFVLVNDQDEIEGYAVGVADSVAFDATLDRNWWPWLRARYPLSSLAVDSKDKGLVQTLHGWQGTSPSLAAQYPAHLHIDLLPSAQGGGNGKRLLLTLLNALKDAGASGVHLGVSATNESAIGFYKHIGFTVLQHQTGSFILAMPFNI